MSDALIALEARVRADPSKTAHPHAPWLAPKLGPDGKPVLDVLVVGAGQSGLATAFGLMRSQVTNILALDKSEQGREGPWLTYARMHTLRSPKDYTGPDLDIPSLTYQSWHEARFGEDGWRNLDLIPRELWAEYLLWFSRLRYRLHHELWPLRLIDQRDDDGRAKTRAWADTGAVSCGHRAALGVFPGV
jgi:FAD-dependent urate hydroxylase